MTDIELAGSWAIRGDLARASAFSTGKDHTGTQRWMVADLSGQGYNETISVRVYVVTPIYASHEELERALDQLYDSLLAAVSGAHKIGGQF